MSDAPLEVMPANKLQAAYVLPEYLQEDLDSAELFDEVISRLRRETEGIPMSTVQQLLIERIASMYVQIRYMEKTGFDGVNKQKELNDYWLKLVAEFNKLLTNHDDKRREQLLLDVQTVVLNAIKLISNEEERRSVRRALTEGFTTLNV